MQYLETRPNAAAGRFVACYWMLRRVLRPARGSGRAQELIFNLGQPYEALVHGAWMRLPASFFWTDHGSATASPVQPNPNNRRALSSAHRRETAARMQRFQRVFPVVGSADARWAGAALRCGYYDQAHSFATFANSPDSRPRPRLPPIQIWPGISCKARRIFPILLGVTSAKLPR